MADNNSDATPGLYDDLGLGSVFGTGGQGAVVMKGKIDDLEKALEEKTKALEKVKNEHAAMVKINKLLMRNMSALYETARLELDRKNRSICELREKLGIPTGAASTSGAARANQNRGGRGGGRVSSGRGGSTGSGGPMRVNMMAESRPHPY